VISLYLWNWLRRRTDSKDYQWQRLPERDYPLMNGKYLDLWDSSRSNTTLYRDTLTYYYYYYYYYYDPGTQFPWKKNYGMQRQDTKTSWNDFSSSSSSSSFISDTGSIEITLKQHKGQRGNIQKYTQNDRSNAESERDKDRN